MFHIFVDLVRFKEELLSLNHSHKLLFHFYGVVTTKVGVILKSLIRTSIFISIGT